MRKLVLHLTTGSVGTDAWEFWEVPEETSQKELDNFAWEQAQSNAEMYGIYLRDEYSENDIDEDDIDGDQYDDNISGDWQEYDPDKHDWHTMTGTPNWEKF